MAAEIYTISIGDGMLDNDYTFYDDGTVERFYDDNQWRPNQKVKMANWEKIKTSDWAKIVAKTAPQTIGKIKGFSENDKN